MSKSTPSLVALLGLVAVAGYQNRDRLSALLAGAGGHAAPPEGGAADGEGSRLADLVATFRQGAADGGGLAGGIGELMDRVRSSGQDAAAESWVSVDRQNQGIEADDLERALGSETVDELSRKTGLSRTEILSRLAAALPETVNRLTPQGRLPSEDEARDLL
jgi:uncharacterized protein YidB (DUF937 family)